MRKILLAGLVAVFAAVFPSVASAQMVTVTQQGGTTQATSVNDNNMHHAYTPFVVNNPAPEPSPWMRARVNNTAGLPNNQLVCADAWSNNTKVNLGCTHTTWSTETGSSAQEINAPLWMLQGGTYKVTYSYQSADGQWHGIEPMHNTQ